MSHGILNVVGKLGQVRQKRLNAALLFVDVSARHDMSHVCSMDD